jgi:hypothetical protein
MWDRMKTGGIGIMATAGGDGKVNAAVYAIPHRIDGETVAWGMTEGRTHGNLKENPNAAFLFLAPGEGYDGVRITLVLKEIHDSGETLERIRDRARETSGPDAAEMVRYVAYFKIVEMRPL